MVVARSSAIDGPRTGLWHVSHPLHQFYFYSPSFCILLCPCPSSPSPRTMVWTDLAPLPSSPLGLDRSSTSFDPLLPAADASVSLSLSIPRFPFQAFLTPPGRPPFPWDTCGNPLEVSITTSIDETDPLVRRQPGRRTKRCASTRVCDGSAQERKARKHVRGREADLETRTQPKRPRGPKTNTRGSANPLLRTVRHV